MSHSSAAAWEMERVYDEHVAAVAAYVHGMCGHPDDTIVGEVFVELWRHRRRFATEASGVRGELLRLARRRIATGCTPAHERSSAVCASLLRLAEPVRHAVLAARFGTDSYARLATADTVTGTEMLRRIERGLRGVRGAAAASNAARPT